MSEPTYHLLQVSDVLDLELASALAELVPVIAWEPQRSLRPKRVPVGAEPERAYADDSTLRLRSLPLLRGFARAPVSWFARTGVEVTERLLRQTADPRHSPLICTVPYFADVAERWPGPVIYWLTDLIAAYSSADRATVERLDRRMVKAATAVCPNSKRLAEYLINTAGCPPLKIHVTPNATRAANVYAEPPADRGQRPVPIADLTRPIAGIIGNLAGNMDWLLLEDLVERTPNIDWVFVGPTNMDIVDADARRAREAVTSHPRARFVGRQPYGELASYARAFDVAVLPYRRCEPTYSGSSTRFYEHLAACRPMIATPGLEELTRKQPLLTLVNTAEEAANAIEHLRLQNFVDDHLLDRWVASRDSTWQQRAISMVKLMNPTVEPSLSPDLCSSDASMG